MPILGTKGEGKERQIAGRVFIVKRIRATIKGIVQGVGFRPFVYNLAVSRQLKGYVKNTGEGVLLEVQGEDPDVEDFFSAIKRSHPPLAMITEVILKELPIDHLESFEVLGSQETPLKEALISPDVSICDDCKRELLDPKDRRFGYAFINCTNCGPRFSIIMDIPYDRANTTMASFQMCPECSYEYHNPMDRRFHAQPNACFTCGPRLWLLDKDGMEIKTEDPISLAAIFLSQGLVLAVKGIGGFHLAVNAMDPLAVRRLRERKRREEKPLAIMVKDLDTLRRMALFSRKERYLLQSKERPIVLVRKRKGSNVAEEVAPGHKFLGVMLPYTPIHVLLMNGPFEALVMTSGNLSEEPIVKDNLEALKRLRGIADYFLVHNRDIHQRCDDSVIKVVRGKARAIRRSRGFVPMAIFLENHFKDMPSTLAVGAELKNTICLTKQNMAFLSQHIGDLENWETYEHFIATIEHLKKILDINPRVLAHDLHPDYMSTMYAMEAQGIQKIPVQHHHAHIVSCMAENGERGPVIGLAMDGTGFGQDGTIWGGEVLLSWIDGYERLGHLEPCWIPGGDAGVKNPWRMALSLLQRSYGEKAMEVALELMGGLDPGEIRMVLEAISKRINSLLTTSLGRLFDGVASLLGIRHKNYYEGQAAMELEMAQAPVRVKPYDIDLEEGSELVLLTRGIVEGVVRDIREGRGTGYIAKRFHISISELLKEATLKASQMTLVKKVALSGGCFQNSTLLSHLERSLKAMGFTVLTHSQVPANDGGIALGQALCAGTKAMAEI